VTSSSEIPRAVAVASTWRRSDVLALVAAVALIGASALVGVALERRGQEILLPSPPLLAHWHPHVGWGTPLAIACVAAGLRLQQRVARLSWRRLLMAGWLLNVSWLCSLALVDGLRRGWIDVLLNPNEYLHDLPRIGSPAKFLSTFTQFIAFSETVDGTQVWTTHVAGHPPLATLVFWLLARVGLGGGFWAGSLCILASSAVCVAVPVTLSELGAPVAARQAIPFAALFPGAVWMAVSADGLFAGVAATGLALACIGAVRRRWSASLGGGLVLGAAVFLSYGLVLFGIVVIVAMIITVRRTDLRHAIVPWLISGAGVTVVGGLHLVFGFNWLSGLAALRIRYYQGIAGDRPFSYFVYANVAAWLISCSPLLAVGLKRAVAVISIRSEDSTPPAQIVSLVALSGLLAALVADVSALSKAETERIWLAFGTIAFTGLALLHGRAAAWAMLGSAGTALLVNHLFATGW
jgi:methylthioxylose transferase